MGELNPRFNKTAAEVSETSFVYNTRDTDLLETYGWELRHNLLSSDIGRRIEELWARDTVTSATDKRSETYKKKTHISLLFKFDIAKMNGRHKKELLEKVTVENDGGLSYKGAKVVVINKNDGKARYTRQATRKLGLFMEELNNTYQETVEATAGRRDARETLATQNNLRADALATRVLDHQSALGFDSRGLVGLLRFDSKHYVDGDKEMPGFAMGEVELLMKSSKPYWIKLSEETDNEHDKRFFKAVADLVEQRADEIRIGLEMEPVTEDGQAAVKESSRIITRYQIGVKEWMKRNMGVLSAVSIGVAGVITTVMLNGRSALRKGARATSGFPKAVANLAKKLGAVLGPILSIIGTILSMGARGLDFLSRNLWILAVAPAYFLYRKYREYIASEGARTAPPRTRRASTTAEKRGEHPA